MDIRFSTLFGDIVVSGVLDSNYREWLTASEGDEPRDRFYCDLIVDTIIAGSPKARGRRLNLTVCVKHDIDSIKEKNMLEDSRHQVPVDSLMIHRVDIDGGKLQIAWTFNDHKDDPSSRRLIRGNMNSIWAGDSIHEDNTWVVYPDGDLQVCW